MTGTAGPYKKRLEGIKPTKGLKELLSQALELAAADNGDAAASGRTAGNDEEDEEETMIPSLTNDQARNILNEWNKENNNKDAAAPWIPIPVIRAMEVLLLADKDKLDRALRQSTLVFTPPPPATELTAEQKKFQKRLERLRLAQEDKKYTKITKNLGLQAPADDVTTRSMTYAASIGLNMIVAPISFGLFMYFFAGGVMNFFWSSSDDDQSAAKQNDEDDFAHELPPQYTGPDIKRVILAVISGVAMMFIEMLLFVIRTHEMDKAMTKKAKKKKHGAFGQYTSKMDKTYQDKK